MSLKNYRPKTVSVPLSGAILGFLSAQKDRGAAAKTIIGYQSFLRLLAEGLPPKINVYESHGKQSSANISPNTRSRRAATLPSVICAPSSMGWRCAASPTSTWSRTEPTIKLPSAATASMSFATASPARRRCRSDRKDARNEVQGKSAGDADLDGPRPVVFGCRGDDVQSGFDAGAGGRLSRRGAGCRRRPDECALSRARHRQIRS